MYTRIIRISLQSTTRNIVADNDIEHEITTNHSRQWYEQNDTPLQTMVCRKFTSDYKVRYDLYSVMLFNNINTYTCGGIHPHVFENISEYFGSKITGGIRS